LSFPAVKPGKSGVTNLLERGKALGPYEASYPERNANFIEVAIPYDQLGGLQPGGAAAFFRVEVIAPCP
jgi:hypothetical protein